MALDLGPPYMLLVVHCGDAATASFESVHRPLAHLLHDAIAVFTDVQCTTPLHVGARVCGDLLALLPASRRRHAAVYLLRCPVAAMAALNIATCPHQPCSP